MGGKRNLLRGKYNPTPKKRKYPNLQWASFPAGGRIKICTRCLKKNKLLYFSSDSLQSKKIASMPKARSNKEQNLHLKKTAVK
ncbi:MAG: hypothetical protein HYW71_02725 [Candidatus Niyogibacteria bacterium]|nr:hypothetical protein [Candidatus Niyogibacteria bacterium]